MDFAVFLRAANVGGHNVFKPAEVAKALGRDFHVKNIGAAGTFAVRGAKTEAALRKKIVSLLEIDAEVLIVPASELLALVASSPFPKKLGKDEKRYASVLAKMPSTSSLPIERPAGSWEIRVFALVGPVALTIRRAVKGGRLYPNEVVEKALGVAATTRGWETIEKVARALEGAP
jgi:uncharacterized protein (DUF1697 family)